jgi:hypothetical protein
MLTEEGLSKTDLTVRDWQVISVGEWSIIKQIFTNCKDFVFFQKCCFLEKLISNKIKYWNIVKEKFILILWLEESRQKEFSFFKRTIFFKFVEYSSYNNSIHSNWHNSLIEMSYVGANIQQFDPGQLIISENDENKYLWRYNSSCSNLFSLSLTHSLSLSFSGMVNIKLFGRFLYKIESKKGKWNFKRETVQWVFWELVPHLENFLSFQLHTKWTLLP